MKAKSLSANILKNTILGWGRHCQKDPNYNWTKHDANAYLLLRRHITDMIHDIYTKNKQRKEAEKINPYINKDNPYHTT